MNMYQISDDKFAVEWPIATINFVDGGQIRMRAPDGFKPEEQPIIGKRQIRSIEYSRIEKSGSLAYCTKQN